MKKQGQAQFVPLSKLRESPTNPRKTFGDLTELTESIKRQGVLQPLLVRPTPTGLELVFGHRRFRASKAAGLKEVPVIVRELSDEEALEVQLVENLQRADIHPLEEAEGFQRLMRDHAYSAEKIAEKIGKSRSAVFASLKLLDLVDDARKAFYQGKLTPSSALLIARMRGERVQLAALEDLVQAGEAEGAPVSFRRASRMLAQRFKAQASTATGRARGGIASVQSKRQDARLHRRTRDAVVGRAVAAIEKRKEYSTDDLRLMAAALVATIVPGAVLARRGQTQDELARAALKMTAAQLRGLLYEIAVSDWVGVSTEEYSDELKALARAHGLTVREVETTTKAVLAEEDRREEAEQLFRKA